MTAYAPPDISFFTGLQFNPNIYENTLVKSANRLYGGLVTIIGTISTIITTPLFQIIQGSTTTLNMIEASTDFINTSYFKIKAPNIYFSPLGTWSAFTCNSSLTQFYNPTQAAVVSPQVKFTNGATDTLVLKEDETAFNNTLSCGFTQPIFIVRNVLLEIFFYFTTTGGSLINNPVGTLTVSSPGYTQTGTLAELQATTTTVTGTTTNLNATTKNIGGTTTNITSTGTTITGTLTSLSATTTTIAGDTANLSSYTTNINGTLTSVSSPTTAISGTLISLSAITTNVSGTTTNLTSPTTNISGSLLTTLSAPTTTVTGTTTNLNATTKNIGGTTTNITSTTTNISGTTTNITSTTTNIGGTTLNMNATTTAFPDATSLTFFSTNGAYPFYDSGNRYILVSSATTINNFTTTFDTIFVVPYSNGTTFQISLRGAAGDVNSGNSFRIFNNGSVAITIATSNGTNRLVGPPIARAGASSYSLASNASVRIQTLLPSGSPFNQTAANASAYFLSLC